MGDSISQDISAQKKSTHTSSSEDEAYHRYGYKSRNEPDFVNLLNTIISGTARLNVLLPSATILAFTNFSPLVTNEGQCDHLDRWIMGLFLTLSSLFCIFFSLTDSFRTSKGRLYYGIATFSGILPLNGTQKKPRTPFEYRLRWADLFHAILSLVAFLTFAASQKDVVDCYYPQLPRKLSYIVPLLVESVIGTLIVLFPSGRKGIGYPFLLQKDTLSSSTTWRCVFHLHEQWKKIFFSLSIDHS